MILLIIAALAAHSVLVAYASTKDNSFKSTSWVVALNAIDGVLVGIALGATYALGV